VPQPTHRAAAPLDNDAGYTRVAKRFFDGGKMITLQLLQDLEFDEKSAHAQPLFVDKGGRVLRFSLEPGQTLKEHNTNESPFYVIVLKGTGMFAGSDGKEHLLGPNSLLIFNPRENHVIRALDEELVFLGLLHGAPSNVSDMVGGKLGPNRKQKKPTRNRSVKLA
jgi:quercetin dioxygenase-like cupin family protein